MSVKFESAGIGLDIRTYKGISGASYLVFKTADGSFHSYKAVEANEAAIDCGADYIAEPENATTTLWAKIWDKVGITL